MVWTAVIITSSPKLRMPLKTILISAASVPNAMPLICGASTHLSPVPFRFPGSLTAPQPLVEKAKQPSLVFARVIQIDHHVLDVFRLP